MMMSLWLFVLCSGLLHFTCTTSRLRSFKFEERKGFPFTNCLTENKSSITLYDEGDAVFLHNFMKDKNSALGVWLGLHRVQNSSVNVPNGGQICVAIENGIQKNFSCSERKNFMCQNGIEYNLNEDKKKNWCQALQYCKTNSVDLASFGDEQEKQNMIDVGQNKTFWIKFRYDEWEWEDQSCSTFREWSESPDPSHTCVYQSNQNKPKKIIPCKIDDLIGRDKLFSTGRVRIVVVQKNSNWEEALKYCEEHHSRLLCIRDESEQEAVEEWLKYTVENITSLWIGLRQSSVFGFWIWSDRIVNYSKWKNNKQPELPISFQCGVINKDQYTWSDKNCLHQLPFLCEEDILFM